MENSNKILPHAQLRYVKDYYAEFPSHKNGRSKVVQEAYVLEILSGDHKWEFSKAWFIDGKKVSTSLVVELELLYNLDYIVTFG